MNTKTIVSFDDAVEILREILIWENGTDQIHATLDGFANDIRDIMIGNLGIDDNGTFYRCGEDGSTLILGMIEEEEDSFF